MVANRKSDYEDPRVEYSAWWRPSRWRDRQSNLLLRSRRHRFNRIPEETRKGNLPGARLERVQTTEPCGSENGICVLSRTPLQRAITSPVPPDSEGRWIDIDLSGHGFGLTVVNIPGSGAGARYGERRGAAKSRFWEALLATSETRVGDHICCCAISIRALMESMKLAGPSTAPNTSSVSRPGVGLMCGDNFMARRPSSPGTRFCGADGLETAFGSTMLSPHRVFYRESEPATIRTMNASEGTPIIH
jgi:hypothetical protein